FRFERFNRRITDDAPYQWTGLNIQRWRSASAPGFESGLGKTALPKFWVLGFKHSAWVVAKKS
ncbi:MAG: hypothetical protein WCJ27_05195, partial [Verrucomicrobiota bacterium]